MYSFYHVDQLTHVKDVHASTIFPYSLLFTICTLHTCLFPMYLMKWIVAKSHSEINLLLYRVVYTSLVLCLSHMQIQINTPTSLKTC